MLWASSSDCNFPQLTALPGRGEGPGSVVLGDGKYQPLWGNRGRKGQAGGSCSVLTGTEAHVGPQRRLVEMLVANSLERPRAARCPASKGVRLGKTVPAPPGRGRGRETTPRPAPGPTSA